MKSKTGNLFLFILGGLGYCLLEIIWRGFTHPTMGIAGGACLMMIVYINKKFAHRSALWRGVLCGLYITAVELLFGIVFNIILQMNVWDYSDRAFNLWGQICPLYTVLWCGLSWLIIKAMEMLFPAKT